MQEVQIPPCHSQTLLIQSFPGLIADFAACFVYVPSEVLKTRLQLQGRYNNPFFKSGYNYKSTYDAARTIVRQEGPSALYYGYKATIFRDLPFSALQFAFYEQERTWAKQWAGSHDIGIGLEIATAASAGGLAGTITCPLDVVKTRIQTQINPTDSSAPQAKNGATPGGQAGKIVAGGVQSSSASNMLSQSEHYRANSARLPTTSLPPETPKLNTSSILTGLRMIYRTEGLKGLFRGVGPRAVWTSVQSGTMLVLYQTLLKRMAKHPWFSDHGPSLI